MQNTIPKEFTPPYILSGMEPNESILVGLSGGADSSALLFMLSLYSKTSGAKIYAAHLNHGIRGAEADRDENFCKEFAKALGIEFFSKKLDIPNIALKSGESVETAARKARYDFFDSIMENHKIKILATAHNADDNFETLLFNISRGTGLSGLCGIPTMRPCKNGLVIRPILNMEKSEILNYCKANNIHFVTDSTNLVNDYTRNKIRNQIIPVLKEINSNATKNASKMTQSLKEDSLYLQKMTDNFIEKFCFENSIALDCLRSTPISITNRAIMRLYTDFSNGETLEVTHINAINILVEKGIPHSSVSLPLGIDAKIENEKLCFIKHQAKTDIDVEYETILKNGKNEITATNVLIFLNTNQYSKNIYKNSILLRIPSDKINGALIARNRRPGDKIFINGMHKSLKKIMNEKKISLDLRSRIPIICDETGILAVPFIGVRDGATNRSNKNANEFVNINVCIH